MKFSLEIADDTRQILEGVCSSMRIPAEMSLEEQLEIAITTLADSYDSQAEPEARDTGSPISAEELKKSLERVTSPNIGTEFRQPPGEATITLIKPKFTFEEILQLAPPAIADGLKNLPDDPLVAEIGKRAVSIVFSEVPIEDWGSETTRKLVGQTAAMLGRTTSK